MPVSITSFSLLNSRFNHNRRHPLGVLVAVCILALSFWIAIPSESSQDLPRTIELALRNAEEWRVYFDCPDDAYLHSGSRDSGVEAYMKAARVRVVSGDDQKELLASVVEAIDDWPAGDKSIVAAMGWEYVVQAATKRGKVTLMFKATGEAVFYRRSTGSPYSGRLNLMDTWRVPFDRLFGLEDSEVR
ncbi:MAG: hypothetical protein JKY61_03075 [Planctomycetes bacterium]|nr:hypothetical protein [Planctomycetota bacterium]